MKETKFISVATLVLVLGLSASSVLALTDVQVAKVKEAVKDVPNLELPAVAGKLMAQSSNENKRDTALEIIKAVVPENHPVTPVLVNALVKVAPEHAAVIAGAATQLAPEQGLAIAKAATKGAKSQADKIANMLASISPRSADRVAAVIISVAPESAGAVTAAVQSAQLIPPERFSRDGVAVLTGGNVNSDPSNSINNGPFNQGQFSNPNQLNKYPGLLGRVP